MQIYVTVVDHKKDNMTSVERREILEDFRLLKSSTGEAFARKILQIIGSILI